MATLAERLSAATTQLGAVSETPRLDAEILLAHALKISRAKLLACLRDSPEAPGFDALIERRLAHEPLAYILGEWEFFSLAFFMEKPILIPRPETEHLVEVVLEEVGDHPAHVLEIGTGTGCVAIAVARHAPACHVTATDILPQAVDLARRNAKRYGLTQTPARVMFLCGDLFSPVTGMPAAFDVVCSNPPYVEEDTWTTLPPVIRLHEAPCALLAGKDGLGIIRQLVSASMLYLKPGGLLAFEMGMGQYESVADMLVDAGYQVIGFRRDLGGVVRIAIARKPTR